MNLHHFVTISLIGAMMIQNFIRVGILISWLHCMSDVWTAGCRVLSHTVYKKVGIVSFFICTAFWMILRNYFIPLVTYYSIKRNVYPPELTEFFAIPLILNGFLVILCLMHVYWLFVFFNIIITGLKTGNPEDL